MAKNGKSFHPKAVWPSGLRRLTRNQFSSEAAVQIRQLSDTFFVMANVGHDPRDSNLNYILFFVEYF